MNGKRENRIDKIVSDLLRGRRLKLRGNRRQHDDDGDDADDRPGARTLHYLKSRRENTNVAITSRMPM